MSLNVLLKGREVAYHLTDSDAKGVLRLRGHPGAADREGRLGGIPADVKALDGVLDLSWHTDQLHRLGAGLEPDLRRGRLATTISMVRRNGRTSFRRKRGA
ncbi:hypothetical protein [Streptomyces aurantiogriseus]|uniref:Uncharacterized protein n=1 Tax=Streptomyces aurantiogriseus TaxID=66870 RepID=A0A918KZE8_9ACTN|nr:hypothetical protein [Streptomyces aurantiogriseus]GGR56577.1 hypothetical protein GCM10010251_86780 [Streptomyces aurantiogriseus]